MKLQNYAAARPASRLSRPRRLIEKALTAVVQETWIRGVLTLKIEDLVQAMGMSWITKWQVSKLCKEIDERVLSFLDRPLAARGVGRLSWRYSADHPRTSKLLISRKNIARQALSPCWPQEGWLPTSASETIIYDVGVKVLAPQASADRASIVERRIYRSHTCIVSF